MVKLRSWLEIIKRRKWCCTSVFKTWDMARGSWCRNHQKWTSSVEPVLWEILFLWQKYESCIFWFGKPNLDQQVERRFSVLFLVEQDIHVCLTSPTKNILVFFCLFDSVFVVFIFRKSFLFNQLIPYLEWLEIIGAVRCRFFGFFLAGLAHRQAAKEL